MNHNPIKTNNPRPKLGGFITGKRKFLADRKKPKAGFIKTTTNSRTTIHSKCGYQNAPNPVLIHIRFMAIINRFSHFSHGNHSRTKPLPIQNKFRTHPPKPKERAQRRKFEAGLRPNNPATRLPHPMTSHRIPAEATNIPKDPFQTAHRAEKSTSRNRERSKKPGTAEKVMEAVLK